MLNRFKSVLMNAVGASELGLQYPNDVDNDMMSDYINSNYVVEVENKPYSRPSFLGLTAEETQVGYFELPRVQLNHISLLLKIWIISMSCKVYLNNLQNVTSSKSHICIGKRGS